MKLLDKVTFLYSQDVEICIFHNYAGAASIGPYFGCPKQVDLHDQQVRNLTPSKIL